MGTEDYDEMTESVINKLAALIEQLVRNQITHQSMNKDKRGENNDCVRDRSTYYEETTHEGHSCCGSKDCSFRSVTCGQKGHLTRMCKQQTACVSTVEVAIEAASCSNIKVKINGKMESKWINTAADITIVNNGTWRQIGKTDCMAADDLVIWAHGDDWKLTIRVYARISYCGKGAAGDVQVTHDCRNILSKNFVMLLKLVMVQVPEASGRVVKASAPEANPDGKDHTVQKVIAMDHTEEKVITQHDFSEETWREFKESQCATRNCTPSRPRWARPEINRSRGESFSAEISSSFFSIAEVECEAEGFRDHNAPAVMENVIVKVECEAGSARDHNAPEAKVKVRGRKTNDSGYTEIFLQDRYSDIVRVASDNTMVGKSSRREKKAKFKPISERDDPIQCDHRSSEIDVRMVIPLEVMNDKQDCFEKSANYQEYNRMYETDVKMVIPSEAVNDNQDCAVNSADYQEHKRMYEINGIGKKGSVHAIQSRENESAAHQLELIHLLPSNKFDQQFIDTALYQRDEFREELDECPKVELGDWDGLSVNSVNSTSSSSHHRSCSNLQSLQSSSQQGHLLQVILEGKPQKKIFEGKPHKKFIEGKPLKKTCSKETKQ